MPLLACVSLPWAVRAGAAAPTIPRWVCPTPTPRPYGPNGPIKADVPTPDPTTLPVYYAIWEQEYGALGGPPFPAPTPYTRSGTTFYFGQLVNLTADLDVQATAQATAMEHAHQRLYLVTLTWHNRGLPVAFAATRQVVLSALRRADGTRISGTGWSWSRDAAQMVGRADDPAMLEAPIPSGDSTLTVPILAPDGTPHTLDLHLDRAGAVGAAAAETTGLRVQWTDGRDPGCADAGTQAAVYDQPALAVQGPAPDGGAGDVVAFAEGQIGRPYCWGGKGWGACSGCDSVNGCVTPSCAAQGGAPCWDCSGLIWGAYQAVGVTLGHGTDNQSQYPVVWQVGTPTDPTQVAQPGDLLLFTAATRDGRPSGRIVHVGLYAGGGLMIHAADYPDGVLATPQVFANRYYGARLARITRPPRR